MGKKRWMLSVLIVLMVLGGTTNVTYADEFEPQRSSWMLSGGVGVFFPF